MISFDFELRKIFGNKYEGCTQAGDELIEYRLKPKKIATAQELAKVEALPKSIRAEIDNIKAKFIPVFEPPETGIPEKVEYIEQYLKELQKR